MDSNLVISVAYCPKSMTTQKRLFSVMVPVGELSYDTWIKALADRVSAMLAKEDNQLTTCLNACERLDILPCDDPAKLGQHILEHNLIFLACIRSTLKDWPLLSEMVAEECIEAKNAITQTNLSNWLDLVQDFILRDISEPLLDEYGQVLKEYNGKAPEPVFDEELKPYVTFINKYLDSTCNLEDMDPDRCSVESFLYHFDYSLSHADGKVKLCFGVRHNQGIGYQSLNELDAIVAKFNGSHTTQVTYTHSIEKKWIFSKQVYKPEYYLLTLEVPLQNDVIKIVTDFYEDILSFFNGGKFNAFMPKPKFDEDVGESFLTVLEDEINILSLVKRYPNFPNILKIAS